MIFFTLVARVYSWLWLYSLYFFFELYGDHLDLHVLTHSFPTRRSSDLARPLRGPTGEANSLRLAGRGVFVAISPWNFPLSIFTGQVAAALAADRKSTRLNSSH